MNRKQRRALEAMKRQGRKIAMPRTKEEVMKDYGQKCAAAGELQYKIAVFSEELDKLNEELKVLNQEFSSLPEPTKEVVDAPQA